MFIASNRSLINRNEHDWKPWHHNLLYTEMKNILYDVESKCRTGQKTNTHEATNQQLVNTVFHVYTLFSLPQWATIISNVCRQATMIKIQSKNLIVNAIASLSFHYPLTNLSSHESIVFVSTQETTSYTREWRHTNVSSCHYYSAASNTQGSFRRYRRWTCARASTPVSASVWRVHSKGHARQRRTKVNI